MCKGHHGEQGEQRMCYLPCLVHTAWCRVCAYRDAMLRFQRSSAFEKRSGLSTEVRYVTRVFFDSVDTSDNVGTNTCPPTVQRILLHGSG